MVDGRSNSRDAWQTGRWQQIAREELRALLVVVAVVGMLALFRSTARIGFQPTFDGHEFLIGWWGDLLSHIHFALPMLAIVQTARRLGPDEGRRRWLALGAALAIAAALAALARCVFLLHEGGIERPEFWPLWSQTAIRFAVPALMLLVVAEYHRRQLRSLEAMRAAEADRESLERASLQARLRTLEAQIEPHFLFNTLANVRRLYDTDPTAGDAMLARLIDYLRFALPSMRDESPTLDREARMIEAYLELQRVRMGRRLDFSINVPAALGAIAVPPMMLLTLVENAIKHGLAPMREGGRIEVGARLEGTRLRLQVADTGRGFGGDTAGGGTGLANIRARLAAMFGPRGELSLQAREPRGLVATIKLPVSVS